MRALIRWALRIFPRPMLIRLSYGVMFVFRPFFKGNQVHCPVCGSSFRKFLPYGVSSRSNVLCPKCLSLERHRLIWLYLQKEAPDKIKSGRFLHVAPEQCFLDRFRNEPGLEYLTADLESPIADLHFDLHDIPLPDNHFDLVFCNHVLEHVKDDRRVLSEIHRILKPGGLAIMQVPMDYSLEATYEDSAIIRPSDRERHFGQKDHVRLYGKDYPERIRQAGFVVDPWSVMEHFTPEEIDRYRLAREEVLYLSRKPR